MIVARKGSMLFADVRRVIHSGDHNPIYTMQIESCLE